MSIQINLTRLFIHWSDINEAIKLIPTKSYEFLQFFQTNSSLIHEMNAQMDLLGRTIHRMDVWQEQMSKTFEFSAQRTDSLIDVTKKVDEWTANIHVFYREQDRMFQRFFSFKYLQ